MRRVARALKLRLCVGIWFLAATLVPGICAGLCATHTCPACIPQVSKAERAAPCCGHCARASGRPGITIAAKKADSCCCKDRKDPVYEAAKPTARPVAQIIAQPFAAVLPGALSLHGNVAFVRSPIQHILRAPPGDLRNVSHSRAPPICVV